MTTTESLAPGAARYGDPDFALAATSTTIDLQLAHRSVRKYLDAPVSDAQLVAIVAAAQSAATSSNQQSWSVVAVRETGQKRRLRELTGSNDFIDAAPLFLVFVADLGRARRLADRHDQPSEGLDYLEATLVGFVDVALAAQNAAVAAESLGLGTVYVGGVRNAPREVAAALALPPHVFAVVGLAIGVPDPSENAGIKPRLPQSSVLHHETYRPEQADAPLADYDDTLAAYNTRHGLAGGWTERIREALADLGFASR